MQVFPTNYQTANDRHYGKPRYVIEIMFAAGQLGTEGVNDIYFGTSDVSGVVNFPYPDRYFPLLHADSITGITQKVNPLDGVSSIGAMSFKLLDARQCVSENFQAADAIGQGLRRQMVQLYALYEGMDWADRVKVRTLFVDTLRMDTNGLDYVLTASDSQKQLKTSVFNPIKTVTTAPYAATGGVTISVSDASSLLTVAQPVYGACGFIKAKSGEIMQWTSKVGNSLVVPASGRGYFGTPAAVGDIGDDISELFVLHENPITMALKVMTSTGAGTNGVWDVLPAHWGAGFEHAVVADWLSVGELLTGLTATPADSDGWYFKFIFDKSTGCKKFIESEICRSVGCFPVVKGDGSLSLKAYNDLANADKVNADAWATVDNIVSFGSLDYDYKAMANELWIDYDESPALSGKYIRAAIFVDSTSKAKHGETQQLKYVIKGLDGTNQAAVSTVYQRFQRVMSRYSRPPMKCTMKLLPRMHGLEIGDVLRVTYPVRDLLSGADLDRAFEVLSVGLNIKTGEPFITCIAQPEVASFWFGGVGALTSISVSPASAAFAVAATQQLVIRAYDSNGTQIPAGTVVWTTSNGAIATVDATGLVTGVSLGSCIISATAGSLTQSSAITVQAAYAGTVTSVATSPASIGLAPANTQIVTAQAFDISMLQVNGVTFNWLSSNPAVATVPPGPSASAVVTAVANGVANITATETGSSVASPASVCTVASAPVPNYVPPAIADAVYEVGTKITTHGPAGGPHIIPNGYSFASGDYWYDGDVTLPSASTMYINGGVRIFARIAGGVGAITINGLVDGAGRGHAGGAGGVASINIGGVWIAPVNAGGSTGFTGRAGAGGRNVYSVGGAAGASTYSISPTIQVNALVQDAFGTWTNVSGLPALSGAAGGGSGAAGNNAPSFGTGTGGAGGAGGADLMLMARAIYINIGTVNLNGINGSAGSAVATLGVAVAASGGGGGSSGTFAAFAERDVNGLPVMAVTRGKVIQTAGAGGSQSESYGTVMHSTAGGSGGNGAFYAQVIG